MSLRRFAASALCLTVVMLTLPSHARGVRVRGGAKIQAQARFVGDGATLELLGTIRDEDDGPLDGTWIELRATAGLQLTGAAGCPTPPVNVAPLDGGLRMQSAKDGRLCLRWREPPDRGSITLRFPGNAFHGAADLSVEFDRTKPARLLTRLRFEPPPSTILLDQPQIAVSAVLELDRTAHASRSGLAITLVDENQREVAAGLTAGDGEVRFELEPKKLGPPGAGKLTARFGGNADLEPVSADQPISRQTIVVVEPDGAATPAHAGGEATVPLSLRAGHGEVDGGVVEALVSGRSVGSAPVRAGKASLAVGIDPRARGSVSLVIRYLPASPFFRASKPLTVDVAIAPPSAVLRVLLIAMVGATGAWVFSSWRRSRKQPLARRRRVALPPGVHAVEDPRQPGRFLGTVIDAHEGILLAGVEVVVRSPTLEGDGVIVHTSTNTRGEFAFDLGDGARPDGTHIEAHSRTHSPESRALPSGGTLKIALMTRRRSLLDRLVRWARRHGPPYDEKAEPTPAQIRAVADARRDVGQWASEIEAAAFGRSEVDATVEQRIRDREPK